MADTHETVADIIRKIRAEADSIEESARGSLKAGENYDGIAFTESDLESALDLAETKRKEADRLEAAWKREKAAIEADALSAGGLVEAMRQKKATAEKSSAVGDAAKLREALKATLDLLWDIHNANRSPQSNQAYAVIRQIKAALAAPPRNCDLARDWVCDLYAHFQPPASIKREMPPEWVDAIMAFCRWLVAPATEKEGGAND